MSRTGIKELRPEHVEVGDIYLVPNEGSLMNYFVPTVVKEVFEDGSFKYSNENGSFWNIASFHFLKLNGVLIKKSKKGKSEVYVSADLIEKIDRLEALVAQGVGSE